MIDTFWFKNQAEHVQFSGWRSKDTFAEVLCQSYLSTGPSRTYLAQWRLRLIIHAVCRPPCPSYDQTHLPFLYFFIFYTLLSFLSILKLQIIQIIMTFLSQTDTAKVAVCQISFYKCLKSAELVRNGGVRNRLGDDQRKLAF